MVIDGRKKWCRFYLLFYCIFGVVFDILYECGVFEIVFICVTVIFVYDKLVFQK